MTETMRPPAAEPTIPIDLPFEIALSSDELHPSRWQAGFRSARPSAVKAYAQVLADAAERWNEANPSFPVEPPVAHDWPASKIAGKPMTEVLITSSIPEQHELFSQTLRQQYEQRQTAKRRRHIGLAVGAAAVAALVLSQAHGHESAPPAAPAAHAIAKPSIKPTPTQKSTQPRVTPAPSHTASPVPPPVAPNKPSGASTTTFRIATFNMLGASHTDKPGGKDYHKMPSSQTRAAKAARFIEQHHFAVAGLQELQRPQLAVITQKLGKTYDIFPAHADYNHHFSENSIIWQQDRFKLVHAGKMVIPYFDGRPGWMPLIELEDRQSGQRFFVSNAHYPADTGAFPRQAKWRADSAQIARQTFQDLVEQGTPVVATCDCNSADHQVRRQGNYLFDNNDDVPLWRYLLHDGFMTEAIASAKHSKDIDHIFYTRKVGNYIVSAKNSSLLQAAQRHDINDHPVGTALVSIQEAD